MIVYEAKLEGTKQQYERLDSAIRTGRFVRNSIIRAWIDKQIRSRNDAYKYCKILANNPRFLRKDESKLKRLQRRLSKTEKKSENRVKARNKLGRAHLKVSRRRNDWVCKLAQRVIQKSDLLAIENLKVRNMAQNHKLAKSINDASWRKFREWLEYFGSVYGVPVIAVNPSYTSINCSNCGETVVKTLSTRTHSCHACSYVADRDKNASRNILKLGLKQLANTVGRTEINDSGENDLYLIQETVDSKSARRKSKPLK